MERNTKDRGYGYKKAYEYEEEIEKFKKTKYRTEKEDLVQQKKVLNNIFDIYNDALLNKIKE